MLSTYGNLEVIVDATLAEFGQRLLQFLDLFDSRLSVLVFRSFSVVSTSRNQMRLGPTEFTIAPFECVDVDFFKWN